MKRKLTHRVLTLALVLAMTLLWLPGVSHAADGNTSNEAQLRSKLSESESGDIILSANIGDIVTPLIIERTITLDLNGHMMTVNLPAAAGNTGNAIKINKDVTLTIKDSDTNGILTVINKANNATAGNGAAINTTDGTLIVQGGMISAIGGVNGAGIGGGNGGAGGVITIIDGSVYATGGGNGAGIGGGGGGGAGGVITISSGSVTTTGGAYGAGIGGGKAGAGGAITINGGVVKAEGSYIHAAGIGGGSESVGGTIFISGGTVTAVGAAGSAHYAGGAGIGGTDTTISIIDGTVTATGCFAGAGIGGSGGRAGGTISITGGTVVAKGSNYNYSTTRLSSAGIGGGGDGSGGTTFIGGGTVTAIAGGSYAASAIGMGTKGVMGTVRITGTYKFWLNKDDTEPDEPTDEGTFTDVNPFQDTAGYKYVKLESQGTTPPPPPPPIYRVTFIDWDGIEIDHQEVISGGAAVIPPDPERSGYIFLGWDKEFSNVTSDLTVTALYEIIINDPPVLTTDSSTRISSTSATVDFTSSAEGKYYYKVISSTEAAPSAENIKSNSGMNVMAQGTNTVSISSLPSNDACKICIVGEDSEGLLSDVLVVDIEAYEVVPPPPPIYNVTFVDWDGIELKQQEVISGEAAEAPPDPVRNGYSFKGWDKDFSSVTSDLTVTALYEIIINDPPVLSSGSSTRNSSTNATVEFTSSADGKYYYKLFDFIEETPSADDIKANSGGSVMIHGENTVSISNLPGVACKFCIVGEDSEGLTSNVLVVYIEPYRTDPYPLPSFVVTFVDWDGAVLKQQIVILGETAAAPPDPVRNGYSFKGWDKGFTNVTSDLTVTAMYEIIINDPPTLSSGSSTRKSSTSATVDFTSSAEGKYYYKIIGSTEAAPSAEKIMTSSGGNGMAQGKNTISISNLLGNDACKICIIGEDSEGLISNVLTVAINKFETDPPLPPTPPQPPTPTPTEAPEEPEKGDDDPIPGTYSDWAKEELNRALAMGLIPTSLLNANIDLRRPISRVEFAGVTVKAYENLANTTVLPNVYNPFTDTQDVDALKAFNAGIMIGISLTEFSPHTELTREQAATALTRVFKRSTISGWTFETDANYPMNYTRPAPFDDDKDISDWAKDSVYFMVANRIILGVGYNVFAPRAVTSVQQAAGYAIATREQAILLALRMVENMGIEEQ